MTTVLQRDVRDLARVDDLPALPRLLALVAARTGTLVNFAEWGAAVGLAQTTLKRYFALLLGTFLAHLVPAWSSSAGQRLVKSPKVHVVDTGLAAHLLGGAVAEASLGPLLEGFVVGEIARASAWSQARPRLFHFRTHAGREVDLVLEDPAGRIVGVEVKASATVGPKDCAGLRELAAILGPRFVRGVVVYCGDRVVPFDANVHALPIRALWT